MHHLVPPNKALQLASHSVIESTRVADPGLGDD
jgi:hypothetical protein